MKPRLLDLFAGAGGAARGYQRSGFYVVGVDVKPQPHYAGDEFHQADALTFPLEGFDAIHASPPCQAYTRLRSLPWLKDREYWDSIPPTRARLQAQSLPWVMENVENAPMPDSVVLCGTMFGLRLFRHRRFESSFFMMSPCHEKHSFTITPGHASLSERRHGLNAWNGVGGHQAGVVRHRENLGIDWMTGKELAQAIPPAFTEWIGIQLLNALTEAPERFAGTVPGSRRAHDEGSNT